MQGRISTRIDMRIKRRTLRRLLSLCGCLLAAVVPCAGEPAREDSFYRVRWERVELPPVLVAGTTHRVLVTLRNASPEIWPDAQMADPVGRTAARAIRLSYRWWEGDRDVLLGDYAVRSDLPWPLRPGESITLPLRVEAPGRAGRYRLQLDLVEELVGWFEPRGAARWITPIEVRPRR